MSNDAAVYSSLLTPRTWTVKHWWHHKRCNNMATFQWQHSNALQYDGILARMHFTQQGRKWDKNSLNIYGCILENYHLGLTLVSRQLIDRTPLYSTSWQTWQETAGYGPSSPHPNFIKASINVPIWITQQEPGKFTVQVTIKDPLSCSLDCHRWPQHVTIQIIWMMTFWMGVGLCMPLMIEDSPFDCLCIHCWSSEFWV